jgi:hypothetical protein
MRREDKVTVAIIATGLVIASVIILFRSSSSEVSDSDQRKTALDKNNRAGIHKQIHALKRRSKQPAATTPSEWTKPTRQSPGCASHSSEDDPISRSIVASLRSLCDRSKNVVLGTVINTKARYGEEGRVFTYITLRVEDKLKGNCGKTIEFRVPGGEIQEDKLLVKVTHMPEFKLGYRGVVFLSANKRLWTPVVDGQQGFLRFYSKGPRTIAMADGFGRLIRGISDDDRIVVAGNESVSDKMLLKRIRTLAN